MRGLYAIVDADFLEARGVPLEPFGASVIAARPAILQLRAKHASPRATLVMLRKLRSRCHDAGVLLFANDRPDLAVLSECDGVHVGQDDLSIADVRAFAPSLRVGVSTHDRSQLERALAERPDYVAFGPVFDTSSKERPDPVVGIDGLRSASAAASAANVPLVAIGGLTLSRMPAVAEQASLGAVISALLPPEGLPGVTDRTRELARCFERLP